jgi:hypothetical protein
MNQPADRRQTDSSADMPQPASKIEKMLTVIGYDGKTARLVSLISAVMLATLVILTGAVGFIGRKDATPRIIDNLFNISGFVDKTIAAKSMEIIDSGYSQMFEIQVGPDVLPTRHTLVFYAREGQDVELTVSGFWSNYQEGRTLNIPVKVNGAILKGRQITLPEMHQSGWFQSDITECLTPGRIVTPGLHEVTIETDSVTTSIKARDRVFVKVIVLVRRGDIPEEKHTEVHNADCKT